MFPVLGHTHYHWRGSEMSFAEETPSEEHRVTEPPEITFGLRLRALRKQLKLEQKPMADLLGVGRPAYSAWEALTNEPSDVVEMAKHIERVTGCDAKWLLGLNMARFLRALTCIDG